jgi:SAM-dependent methyltransferase
VTRLRVDAPDLLTLAAWLRARLPARAPLALDVPDPDLHPAPVAGGWRGWVDLAGLLGCRLEAPCPLPGGRAGLTLAPLPPEAAWHRGGTDPDRDADPDRYADPHGFARIDKLAHPAFALPLLEALARVRPRDGARVLVLGCHRGDEIAALHRLAPPPRGLAVLGIDHSPTLLAQAAARAFGDPPARYLQADLRALPDDLGTFDLVIAVAVLQSPAIDDRALVRRLVQRHLTPAGALLLGWPNSRFRGGDPVWGARTRNFTESDLSLVVHDLASHRRYLHQHGFRTHVGGRLDLLLTAWRQA